MPRISVVIPTYNRITYLKRAVDSVLNQTYRDFELIVVDDGSDDGTCEYICSLRDERVVYIRQDNSGVSCARNKGIKRGKGDFISFLDSDDRWLPEKLERDMEFFKNFKNYVIVQSDEIWIRNGKKVNKMKKHEKRGGDIYGESLKLCFISPSAVTVKRKLFDEVGLFDETLPACEDYDMWLRVTARYEVGFIPEYLVVKYGGHEDQLSKRYYGMDRFRIYAMMKILNSGILDGYKRRITVLELRKKICVYLEGCKKRGKDSEVSYYEGLIREYGDLQ